MTHTTPAQARDLADILQYLTEDSDSRDLTEPALRSLAEQLEAVTADCERFANQTFKAKAEAKTLVDHANAERDAYKAELKNIADANPNNWDAPFNDTATFQAWAQSRARAAIAKEAK